MTQEIKKVNDDTVLTENNEVNEQTGINSQTEDNENAQNTEIKISFKKRLSLEEVLALINNVVDGCFIENSDTHIEEYNPTILDFRIKSSIVLYYSDYIMQMTNYFAPLFGDDKEGLSATVNDINRLYNFCCDRMSLTPENLQSLGLDVEQISSIIGAIDNIISHKKVLIENKAGFVYFIDKFEQDMKNFSDGLNDILGSVADVFNNADSDEFKKELLNKINPSAMVDEYIKKSPLLNESKASKANGKTKKKVIPMSNYTQGDKNG